MAASVASMFLSRSRRLSTSGAADLSKAAENVCTIKEPKMAASRLLSRRLLSSDGGILNKEQEAAENVYIKKTEQEKLEKLARKGRGEPVTTAAGSSSTNASNPPAATEGASEKKRRYLPFLGGAIALAFGSAAYYYWKTYSQEKEKIKEEHAN